MCKSLVRYIGVIALIIIFMLSMVKHTNAKLESLETANTALKQQNKQLENEIQTMNENIETYKNSEPFAVLSAINFLKEEDKYTWFKLYYHTLFEQYDLDDLPETPYDVFTEREINMMLKCIETETHGADFDYKVNVANVILNRVESDQFPTDPVELITQNNQFAYGRDNISDSTVYALLYAYMIGSEETNNCIGFRSDKKVENWNDWEYSYYDGVHWFYKLKE